MAKGENIFKRKDGRWEARYIKEHDPSGKIRYGFCYGRTYQEAKEKATKCRAQIFNQPQCGQEQQPNFGFFCDEWLRIKKVSLKESTYVKYSTTLERHIKPHLGDCSPLQLSSGKIEEFTAVLLNENGLASKSVKDILVLLRSVLKYTQEQIPERFPHVRIGYPKEQKKEMRVLSAEEQSRFIHYLQMDMTPCKFGILLALLTGLRIGELCALRWENISLQDKTLRVTATMQRLKNMQSDAYTRTKIVVGAPKSDSSLRTIPMTDFACRLCEQLNPSSQKAYVLTGTTNYMEPRTLQYRFAGYAKECGLEGVHFHTLRHTFATRCVEVGFEIKSLSEILGHSTTTITLERYVHSSMTLKRSNMTKLSAVGF